MTHILNIQLNATAAAEAVAIEMRDSMRFEYETEFKYISNIATTHFPIYLSTTLGMTRSHIRNSTGRVRNILYVVGIR